MLTVYANSKVQSRLTKELSKDFHWRKSVGYKVYANARILPYIKEKRFSGGVCSTDGRFVDSSALHENAYDGSYAYESTSIERKDTDAVFLGTWIGIYGHAITDNIKKLWFLSSEDYKRLSPSPELIYNYLGEGELPEYFIEILSSLNIDLRLLKRVDRVTEYSRVIIPDNSFILDGGERFFTDAFKSTIAAICAKGVKMDVYPEKIYLSRKESANNRDYGEGHLEEAFQQHGFEIIVPENYSFLEQVALLNHCDCLAATEGSIAHNAVFCKPGAELILLRKSDYVNTYQSAINAMNSLNVSYVDAHHTINVRDPWVGPFFLWRTRFLNACLGDTVKEESVWFHTKWYKYLFRVVKEKMRQWLQ